MFHVWTVKAGALMMRFQLLGLSLPGLRRWSWGLSQANDRHGDV